MLLGKASSIAEVGWYLSAKHGDVRIKVQPGMQLGETSLGDLSFEARDTFVELDVRDSGELQLSCTSPSHRLGVPTQTLTITPNASLQLELPNHSLHLSTEFATGHAASEQLTIHVFEDDPSGATTQLGGQIVVQEARPPSSVTRLVRRVQRWPWQQWLRAPAVVMSAVVLIAFLIATQLERPSTARLTPATTSSVDVEALLNGDELPNAATIDSVIESLLASRAASSDDRGVGQALGDLAERLAAEAEAQHQAGATSQALRLLSQAQATGSAVERVQRAARLITQRPWQGCLEPFGNLLQRAQRRAV